jgi:hypothetical protein
MEQEWHFTQKDSLYCADVAEEIVTVTITQMLLSIDKACEDVSVERIKLIRREVAAVNSGISEPLTSEDVTRVRGIFQE